MNLTDEERETQIAACAARVGSADTVMEKRAAWNHMRALIAGRSPEMIAQLERQHGLEREIRTVRAA